MHAIVYTNEMYISFVVDNTILFLETYKIILYESGIEHTNNNEILVHSSNNSQPSQS